jgi:hypothetical protein
MTERLKAKDAAAWGKSVRAVLRKAKVPATEVALAVFGNRSRPSQSFLHQYLSGVRRPGAERVRSITRAIGSLAESDGARAYLDAEACILGLLSPTLDDRLCDAGAAFEIVGVSLASALAFIRRHGLARFRLTGADRTPAFAFVRRLIERLDGLAPDRQGKLLDALHRTHRKLLFDAIDGRVRYELGWEALRRCFDRYGISLDALIREREFGTPEQLRLNAALRDAIVSAFATQFPDSTAAERFAAQRTIEQAFTTYLEQHPVFLAIKQQGPDFFSRLLLAHRAGKPLKLALPRVRQQDPVRDFLRDYPEQPRAIKRPSKRKKGAQ